MEALGVSDILTKSMGTPTHHNVLKACFEGLKSLRSAEDVARLRGKTVQEIFS
jgi:small subunit ribosomal protein S5